MMKDFVTTKTADVGAVLDERGSEYGDFRTQAHIAQELKETARDTPGWDRMEGMHREAVDMILHKLSRLLNGNPNHIDGWLDIEGYARCVRVRLEKGIDNIPRV